MSPFLKIQIEKRRKELRNNGGMKSLFKEILEEDKNADQRISILFGRKKRTK